MSLTRLNNRVAGRLLILLMIAFGPSMCAGCSTVMAARAPAKKDLSVLTPGIPRGRVIAELGTPVHSDRKSDGDVDTFAFKQGYKASTRFSRAFFHSAADVFTFGLWEVAATPLEGVLQGEDIRAQVSYNDAGVVNRVEYFSGAHLAHGGATLAPWMRSKSTVQTAVVEAQRDSLEQTILPASGEGIGDP